MRCVEFSNQYFEFEGRRVNKMWGRGSLLLLGLLLLVAFGKDVRAAGSLPAPEFDLVRPSAGYHGLVAEDALEVEVHPPIRAAPDVCAFSVLGAPAPDDVPFMIRMRDPATGTAELLASRPLNCEQRRSYRFDITAQSCDGVLSSNVSVHVKVTDVNEFAPVFSEPSFVVAVDEGRLYQQLITLKAHDNDCSPKYGDICRYELITQDQPFSIDSKGVVSNTEPLDFEKSHNHILSLVAYDCGMKASSPVMLTVKVNRVCHLGWKGIPSEVDYWPGTGRLELFPQATLELCSVPCSVQEVHSRVTLSTEHIGRGCDRDTYSAARQRKICGASTDSIDLLPAPSADHPWTAGLHSDDAALPASNDVNAEPGNKGGAAGEAAANEEAVYEFDGDGVVVPRAVIGHNFTNTFTISTWMKHAPQDIDDKHQKEHILCVADDHQMNRHHTALFVRNCRLILLLRHDPSDGGALNSFQPAEWRWKLPQVCDDEWHHYSVQARLPEVTLYVDGHSFHPEGGDAPEVLDDWPLHPTKGINTTLSIGACWQGSEKRMRHGLQGALAGLTVLPGGVEPVRVLGCLTRCMEALDTPAMELLQPSMELLTNNEMTQITIEGDNITNLETLLRKVAYTNSRDLPTPGRRPVTVDTNILCTSGGGLRMSAVSAHVVVLPPHQPAILINGTSNFAQEYQSFRAGLRIFPDVSLNLATPRADSPGPRQTVAPPAPAEVSECSVAVYPPLNPDHETLLLPDNLIRDLGLASSVTRQGTTVTGPNTVQRYTNILRQLHYANRKPAYYLNRAFKLTCSQTSGRASSNEYLQTVTVIHPQLNMDHGGGDQPHATVLEDDSLDRYGHQATLADVIAAVDLSDNVTSDDAAPLGQDLRKSASPVHQSPSRASHARVSPHLVDQGAYSTSDVLPPTVAGAGHAVTIIVVVCVGFLVVLVVLAAIRVRAAHVRRAGAKPAPADHHTADAEMAWDDTALNITLNPMEMELSEGGRLHGAAAAAAADDQSDDSSDGGSSHYGDELDSTDEEEDEVELDDSAAQRKELEWDDSTLKM